MTTLLFDTLKLSKMLQENGHFTTEQANALAEGLSSAAIDNLATREDLKILSTKLELLATKEEVHGVEREIHGVETRLLRWIVSASAFQVIAVIVALYLHK